MTTVSRGREATNNLIHGTPELEIPADPETLPIEQQPKYERLCHALKHEEADGKIVDVPLAYVSLGRNIRKRVDMDSPQMVALKASLDSEGLIHPVTIVLEDGKPTLKAGFRRFKAMQAIGWTETKAMIRTRSDVKGDVIQAVENILREDLDALDYCDALKLIKEKEGISNEDLAARVGLKDRGLIGYYLKASDWDEDAKEAFRAAGFTRVHVYRICRLDESNDKAKLLEMIQQLKEPHRQGASAVDDEIKTKIAQVIKSHKIPRKGAFRKAATSYYGLDPKERKAFKDFIKSL